MPSTGSPATWDFMKTGRGRREQQHMPKAKGKGADMVWRSQEASLWSPTTPCPLCIHMNKTRLEVH